MLVAVGEVDEDAGDEPGDDGDDRAGQGEDRAEESPGEGDGFFAGLRRRDGKGGAGALACPLFAQPRCDGDHRARAQRQGDAQKRGFDEWNDPFAAEVFEHPFAGDQDMDDPGEKEAEEEPEGRFGEDHPQFIEKRGHGRTIREA